jgi:hypothetical protein
VIDDNRRTNRGAGLRVHDDVYAKIGKVRMGTRQSRPKTKNGCAGGGGEKLAQTGG